MALLDRSEIEVLWVEPTCRTTGEHCFQWRGRYRQVHVSVESLAELPSDSHPDFVREMLYFKFLVGDVTLTGGTQ